MTLRIATRKSPLALWQAHHVAERLKQAHPGLEVTLVEMSTEGDRFLSAPLSRAGGKGLFVKEIEQALLDGQADVAVHSLKDMTSQIPSGLALAAVAEREDPRDALVGRTVKRWVELPRAAKVGTSSLRRACQLKEKRPDLEIVPLRGNVQTRLRKLEELELDVAVLALAGLKRLGLEWRATELLEPAVSLPAVGQGVLGIEARADDAETLERLAVLEHPPTRQVVAAERAFLARLEGGCLVPMAAHAVLEGAELWVRGLIGRPDGTRVVRGERRGPAGTGATLGETLAEELLQRGGREILDAFRGNPGVEGDPPGPPDPSPR
ncbi:MAG TPA: hydroxymethylbilane synthase [Myxococcales bacterium]|nr:hydroxymethylbilane synthase [Myxococcales bacterium]